MNATKADVTSRKRSCSGPLLGILFAALVALVGLGVLAIWLVNVLAGAEIDASTVVLKC